VKILSTHPESQGPFVEINASDFDKSKHELFVEAPPAFVPPPPPGNPPPPGPLDGLPADWKEKSKTDDLKAIAAAVAGRTVENRKQAVEVIEEALAAKQ
jgi:hypothetical protein